MCARIVDWLTDEQIADFVGTVGAMRLGLERRPNYNLAPTQSVAAVRNSGDGQREAVPLRWGLIPSWSKEGPKGKPLINARAETVVTKPAFRKAFASRRCLVPVSGFYEWQAREGGPKQPFFIYLAGGEIMTFAGLWETWYGDPAAPLESGAMVTTAANAEMEAIHNRMPVILRGPEAQAACLDTSLPQEEVLKLVEPLEPGSLVLRPVSAAVNSIRNNGEGLLEERLVDALPAPLKIRRPKAPDTNEAQDLQGDFF